MQECEISPCGCVKAADKYSTLIQMQVLCQMFNSLLKPKLLEGLLHSWQNAMEQEEYLKSWDMEALHNTLQSEYIDKTYPCAYAVALM